MLLDQLFHAKDRRLGFLSARGGVELDGDPRRFGEHFDLLGQLLLIRDPAAGHCARVVGRDVVEQVDDLLGGEGIGRIGGPSRAERSQRGDEGTERDEKGQSFHGTPLPWQRAPPKSKNCRRNFKRDAKGARTAYKIGSMRGSFGSEAVTHRC